MNVNNVNWIMRDHPVMLEHALSFIIERWKFGVCGNEGAAAMSGIIENFSVQRLSKVKRGFKVFQEGYVLS